jgi:hypothetical protein
MKRSSAWIAAAALIALPSMAMGSGSAPVGKAAPATVPYLCSDGQTASVVYRSGSDFLHARAIVTHQGQVFDLQAAPTLYGARYRGETPGATALAWSLRGEEAVLSEAPEADSYTRAERELLRCVRVRGAPAAESHGSDSH